MKRANHILAATFGWDASEVSEYRYQKYQSPAVYNISDKYFAVSKTIPKHKGVGQGWYKYQDQFFAENTVIWVSDN